MGFPQLSSPLLFFKDVIFILLLSIRVPKFLHPISRDARSLPDLYVAVRFLHQTSRHIKSLPYCRFKVSRSFHPDQVFPGPSTQLLDYCSFPLPPEDGQTCQIPFCVSYPISASTAFSEMAVPSPFNPFAPLTHCILLSCTADKGASCKQVVLNLQHHRKKGTV